MSDHSDDEVSFPEPPSEFQYPRAPTADDSVTFPDAPPPSHDDDAAASFPSAGELAFPDVPTNDLEDFPDAPPSENLDDLSARLKRLNPSSNFSAAPTRVHVPDDTRTNAEKVNDLLAMYRDESQINHDDDEEEEEETKKKTKPKKKHHDSKTQKSMQEYLQAAEQQRGDLNRVNRVADLNPDNIFLAPNPAAKEQRAKARYDANQKRHNARIAAQVMRDAKEAGIDPRSIDRSLYENAALDSDLEDDDDSDSIELSDSSD